MNAVKALRTHMFIAAALLVTWMSLPCAVAAEIPGGEEGYASHVVPFFKSYCVQCHGPTKNKGKITLHALDGDLSAGQEIERWAVILKMVESGEMPPEDEKQPSVEERKAVAAWIESGMRDHINKASKVAQAPVTRRLTNFEYQNTMRDLLGFELKLIDNLPKDPVKPYHFNNTAKFMRMGPEQIDRYTENARLAMASAIVDPAKPEIHKTSRAWTSAGVERGMGSDEISVWGNRRNTAATGMGLKSFPSTGEYRIRIKASAILPPGTSEVPLRLVMGYNGLEENQATFQIETVGVMRLSNSPDEPQIFEFVGRIENHPPRPGRMVNGKRLPDTMAITPQNLYDDGTLNDGNDPLAKPRAVVEWIEFEAPLTEVWPPAHHTRIIFDSPLRESDPPAYIRQVLERFMSRAFRRPATKEEVDRFAKIYELILPQLGTLEAAMRETLAMVLISPQFLYHTVSSDGAEFAQYEMASKLSYFLWGSMPDEELMQLAAAKKLADASVIEQQVRRLLADKRCGDFVENFTSQWLSLAKLKTVSVNRELFPRFLYWVTRGERTGTEVPYRPTIRDYMHEESVGFVAQLIRQNASALNIVDSDFAFLNQPLAAHYGVEGVEGIHLRAVPIKPEHQLGGLLTNGSILVANSTGSAPHPIYRAVWLREAILGDEVKDPPAEVPALSDTAGDSAANAVTIKDLLAKHRQVESCNDCHVRLDPWGIPFERYNAAGKFQPLVPKDGTRVRAFDRATHKDMQGYETYLQSINTIEVDAKARVPHGPQVDGMSDLKAYLLKDRKDAIARNVIRRLLAYGIGRELTYRDRFAVDRLLEHAKESDLKLQDIIIAICQSETFKGSSSSE